ncbi:sulfite exporter TauE/SafE family protein [Bradyrhizobium sp. LHD-71]|uniref:sulfite exporter TauE/SafE family protein n=1 Tax=Bradyrhizobium sp. LHD-71 TaxID=3072141 RepID=UPI00280ECD0C|nr:sulfite exporter TauE/SafE family protein [Bradyrhizobium sp. LHD-71]MDQ8730716.1 sulfite exporter TauE/SafE family protein [Bradyrhizobium sp. LHD-71]
MPILTDILSAFANISLTQLAVVTGVTLFASVIGGVAGYGTGALMPLVLVPMVGAEPVVPIIAISALFTNTGRVAAFFRHIDGRRSAIVIAAAAFTCVLGAYAYTRLSGAGAALVIGSMLILSVPLRRLAHRRAVKLHDGGLVIGAAGYGLVVGGTTGSGAILLSLLMAAGLEGAAVIATDAAVTIAIGIVKVAVFGVTGAVTAQVIVFGLLIGAVAFPGGFIAKALLERLPIRVHTAMLDAVIILGGVVMIIAALR